MSEQTVHNWKRLFLDAGRAGLAQGRRRRSTREAMLEADAAAASAGEKMGAPLALIGSAFMILMGYPPLAGIMDSSTLTGL